MWIARHPRLTAALSVAAFLALTRAAVPDGAERAPIQYAVVTALGYGHLIGAALPSLRRAARAGALACAFRLCAAASALAAYAAAVAFFPPLVLGPVALSVWHIAENDAAMARALRSGTPLRAGAGGRALPLACTALVLALAGAALPDPGRFGDLFCAVTLHHLVAWLAFARARGASGGRLAALHAGPAALAGALWLVPDAGLCAIVFSPGLYLFWSALHVLQTARARAAA